MTDNIKAKLVFFTFSSYGLRGCEYREDEWEDPILVGVN